MSRTPLLERLETFVHRRTITSLRELREHGIHHQVVKRALDLGLLTKLDRGLYATATCTLDFQHRIAIACMCVPNGVVCLESALQFHGIVRLPSDSIWMAIDRKARKPKVKGLRLHFVRFSGDALTQGVVNTRIDGNPVRVYSVAKTVADCFKYRNKIGVETAARSFRESVDQRKCSRERLLHFAGICRVVKLVRLAFKC